MAQVVQKVVRLSAQGGAEVITTMREMGEQGEKAFQKIDRAAATANTNVKATAETVGGLSNATRASLGNSANQIQDFVVQVSGGTSALRAFTQQAPQLLSAFGPEGAILGTVVALGAAIGGPLVKSFFDLDDSAGKLPNILDAAAESMFNSASAAEKYADRLKAATESQRYFLEKAAEIDRTTVLKGSQSTIGSLLDAAQSDVNRRASAQIEGGNTGEISDLYAATAATSRVRGDFTAQITAAITRGDSKAVQDIIKAAGLVHDQAGLDAANKLVAMADQVALDNAVAAGNVAELEHRAASAPGATHRTDPAQRVAERIADLKAQIAAVGNVGAEAAARASIPEGASASQAEEIRQLTSQLALREASQRAAAAEARTDETADAKRQARNAQLDQLHDKIMGQISAEAELARKRDEIDKAAAQGAISDTERLQARQKALNDYWKAERLAAGVPDGAQLTKSRNELAVEAQAKLDAQLRDRTLHDTAAGGVGSALLQLEDVGEHVGDAIRNSIVGGVERANDAIVTMVQAGKVNLESLAAVAQQVEGDLIKLALQVAESALIRGIGGAIAGGIAGAGGGAAAGGSYSVGVGSDYTYVGVHHAGGMAEDAGPGRYVDPRLFLGAPRYHDGVYLASDEHRAILQTGERVLNRQETRDYDRGRGGIEKIELHNHGSQPIKDVQTQRSPDGKTLKIMFGQMFNEHVAQGGGNRVFEQMFGMKPQPRR